jgi:penicillin-binding protein 1A
LTAYYDRKFRIWIPISSLPDIVVHAVITAEDDMFFEHRGVNYKATWDALVHDMQKRRFARGGSTITQQMIKNVLLTREKTLTRKLKEYILARKAEELLTKRQILQIYLNEVEWGDNIYGIEAASRFYFNKHAAELTAAESALLAGMLPNPRYYNPYKRPDKAKSRQERVLANMLQAKLITSDIYEAGVSNPVELRQENGATLRGANSRLCSEQVLEQLLLRLLGDQLYRGGLNIKTSIDKIIQDEMNVLEDAAPENASSHAKIVVVQQGEQIRGMACSSHMEEIVREKYGSGVFHPTDYEVNTMRLDAITRDRIILSVAGGKQ